MKNIIFSIMALFTISFAAQAQNSKSEKEEVVCFYVDAEHIACMKLDETADTKSKKGTGKMKEDPELKLKSNKISNGEVSKEQYEELYLRKLYTKEKIGLDI